MQDRQCDGIGAEKNEAHGAIEPLRRSEAIPRCTAGARGRYRERETFRTIKLPGFACGRPAPVDGRYSAVGR